MLKHGYVRALIGLVMLPGVLPNPAGRLAFAQAPDTPTPILTAEGDSGEGEATPEPSPAEPVESHTPVPGEPEEPQPTDVPLETPPPTDNTPDEPDDAEPVDSFTLEIDWEAANGHASGVRCERAQEQVEALSIDAGCIPVSEKRVRLRVAGIGGQKEVRRLLFGEVMPEFGAQGGKARLEISMPASAGQRVDLILQSRPKGRRADRPADLQTTLRFA